MEALNADEGAPQLSAETMAALAEFYQEQMKPASEGVSEDWSLSQFWYDKATADAVAKEAVAASKNGRIACLSTPTIYKALRGMHYNKKKATLFEYDRRFGSFGKHFVFYDYKSPDDVPPELHHTFDFVCADPPFLARECLAKFLVTMALLCKDASTPVLLLTGAAMAPIVTDLTGGSLKQLKFVPRHEKERLQNPFAAYANFAHGEFV
eukprot:TRINITY_DN17669_c0_g1_i1.p1 TRINITY_DN17669_c0_g1~~TRINITY_DN17669_c0_g1_i1.p1  ORF type:complete len:209 (-),score=80.17 TRINITY_DN17669_c0_g1_i1:38-664(-)